MKRKGIGSWKYHRRRHGSSGASVPANGPWKCTWLCLQSISTGSWRAACNTYGCTTITTANFPMLRKQTVIGVWQRKRGANSHGHCHPPGQRLCCIRASLQLSNSAWAERGGSFFNQNSSLDSSKPTPTGAESINQEGPLAHDTVQHRPGEGVLDKSQPVFEWMHRRLPKQWAVESWYCPRQRIPPLLALWLITYKFTVQQLNKELHKLSSKAGFTHYANSDNEKHKCRSSPYSLETIL